jgi:hypothetical protein
LSLKMVREAPSPPRLLIPLDIPLLSVGGILVERCTL